MKKTLPLLLLSLTASAAVDFNKDVWLLADFDSPARINGEAHLQEQDAAGFVPGKFGRGYCFYRETNNKLPPMEQFFANAENFKGKGIALGKTSLKFDGGGFMTVTERPTGIPYHWVGLDAGCTWSFYVKGARGVRLALWPKLGALDEKTRAGLLKKYPALAKDELKDVLVTNKVELTGEWQRVQCHAVCDVRTGGSRKTALRIAATGPVEIDRFQLQATGIYPFKRRFEAGVWVDGGQRSSGTVLTCSDPLQLAGFPYAAGTMSCWFKNAPGVPEKTPINFWGLTKSWGSEWICTSVSMTSGQGGGVLHLRPGLSRRDEWTHVAYTWREGRMACYINGKLAGELVPDGKHVKAVGMVPLSDDKGTLRVGASHIGSGQGDVILDDFAILNRELDAGEIDLLAHSTRPLAAGSKQVLAENIFFRTFFRDQTDARLRFRVVAPESAAYALEVKIGDIERSVSPVTLKKGVSYLEIPVAPALYKPGKYGFELSLRAGSGEVALARAGELEIKGRLGTDPFIFNSWGGSQAVHVPFLKRLGVNSCNINWNDRLQLRHALEEGLFANVRYENGNEWFRQDFDWAGIRAKTVRDLDYIAALPNWRTTLLNSEIYGSGPAKKAQDNPKYLKLVEKATGVKPDFTFGDAPSEVSFGRLGVAPVRGEIDHKACPALETLNYITDRGLPSILSNYETAKAIKSVKPVLVWSEPMWGGLADSVDMGADWEYEYSIYATLRQLRAHSAACRRFGKPYMPTLGGCYWPEQRGRHPTRKDKDGRHEGVNMAQGSDEVAIKTWLSIGAVPAHNLSWFGLDAWEYGVSNALKYAASPTNAVPVIAEADCAERYGKRWREDLAPAAELLRDMPNVPAKIAYLDLPEVAHAGGFWWGHYHFGNTLGGVLSKGPANFDYVGREDLLAGRLADYEYVVYPMSRVVYREHADALRKLARRGVKIVLDSYATNCYENAIVLKNVMYKPNRWAEMAADFGAWYDPVAKEVAARQGASSPATDGRTSFTLEKEYKGVRYVTVVNDARDPKPSYLNIFKTNDWYRVVGAPQTIETEIRKVAKGAKVYRFNRRGRGCSVSRKGGTVRIRGDFAPAEGAVYCVYPKALKAPALSLDGPARPGATVNLVVRVEDEDGAGAPGRQLVELTLADGDGVARDESGRYVVEDGQVTIPLRIAKGEAPTGFFGKWKATVVDLTTGKSDSLGIAIK